MSENDAVSSTKPPARPTIVLPPRAPIETFLGSGGFGVSPGPLTLVSSFFSDTDPESECRTFSQLLAGAMASPAAASLSESTRDGTDLGYKLNRPAGLAVTQPQVFTIPAGISPATLLGSPGLFPGQGPFGMSHQQALAHVTAQAQSNMCMQGSVPMSSITSTQEPKEEHRIQNPDERLHQSSMAVAKPADDGFNWRKYGQKPVKGSEFPRSYYKCSHPGCPVRKKVERSHDGQVTEIIYKGQHNHPPPQTKRGKDTCNRSGNLNLQIQNESTSRDPESSQATGECLSSSEDLGDEADTTAQHGEDGDEPGAKKRSLEARIPEQTTSHRTVTEPKIVVQTMSEVDLLDDGFRWRKYGQKVVKGNPYPRSYYKCTFQGCNVRKHIERASTDPKSVITTYEGKHNHDIPAPRASSHYTATNSMPQPLPKPHNAANQNVFRGNSSSSSENRQPVALLQLKEESL